MEIRPSGPDLEDKLADIESEIIRGEFQMPIGCKYMFFAQNADLVCF